jgi:hypothetical protein
MVREIFFVFQWWRQKKFLGTTAVKDLAFVRFEVLTAASMKKARAIALMMEAASTSEMSVNLYQTVWRSNPEDSHLRPSI